MNAFVEGLLERWWIVQLYFLISLALCIAEMIDHRFGTAAIELIAATLAYVGPANFINACLSRKEHNRNFVNLLIHLIIGILCVLAAFWLMLWSGFHTKLFGVEFVGLYWAAAGILVAVLAARKEDDA